MFKSIYKISLFLIFFYFLSIHVLRAEIVEKINIEGNQRISSKDVWSKRPGTGIPSRYMSKIIGKKAKKFIKKNTLIKKSQLNYKI